MVAVIGGDSLLAREVRDLLAERKPAPRMQLISTGTDGAVLTERDDEPVLMQSLTAESLEGSRIAFLAGTQASSRRALRLNTGNGPLLIDLTGALEDQPNARLRAPLVESPRIGLDPSAIHVVAHPAATALALLYARIDSCANIRRSVVNVFEPASERGRKGMDELQQQTVALLSFKDLNKDVFDAQVAFNLLPEFGEEAMEPLGDVEVRMERNLATLLAAYPRVPMPSVRLIQAPVFHGYCASVWVEFEESPGVRVLADALAGGAVEVRSEAQEPASNTGAAGQNGITVSNIVEDRNCSRALWLWMASDNIRLAAQNAIAAADEAL